jgi:hypothetical protein
VFSGDKLIEVGTKIKKPSVGDRSICAAPLDSEGITIYLCYVDLGRVDLLVRRDSIPTVLTLSGPPFAASLNAIVSRSSNQWPRGIATMLVILLRMPLRDLSIPVIIENDPRQWVVRTSDLVELTIPKICCAAG